MIIATAGHVDHGKTSLVNALTGVDTDRLQEEKARGLTIDLGFAYTDGDAGERLGFVDVPGHIRFINNMLAGVSAIDHALLVIAADDGVMPQTVEHLEILNLLGIPAGTIAVTKIDRVEPEHLSNTMESVAQFVRGTFLQDAEIIPVSVTKGEGIDTLKLALDIAADDLERKKPAGQFRLAIDRRFTIRGSGIVVTGSVFSGSIRTGDELLLQPRGIAVRVRGLRTQDQETDSATTGDRCAVNITGADLELETIHRGNWLTGNPSPPTDRADALIRVLASEEKPFRHWTPVHVHSGANHVTGRAATLEGPRIQPGEEGLVQLVLDEPINLCTGDRVVLRDQGATRTLGGGVILAPHSPGRGRARPDRVALLKSIDPGSASITFDRLISTATLGIDVSRFANDANLATGEISELIEHSEAMMLDPGFAISSSHFSERLEQLTALLDQWHESNPAKAGLPVNQVQALVRRWPPVLTQSVIEHLVSGKALEKEGNLIRRPGAGVRLSSKEQKILEQALPLLQADPLKPPVLHDLAAALGETPRDLEKILVQVVKTGQLVRPVKNRFFTPEAMDELKSKLHDAADTNGQFSVQQYRDASGIGRNLCIEILEYFDRRGITRRLGDIRQIVDHGGNQACP